MTQYHIQYINPTEDRVMIQADSNEVVFGDSFLTAPAQEEGARLMIPIHRVLLITAITVI